MAFEQLGKLLDGDLHGAEHMITRTAYRGNKSRSVRLSSGPHPFQPSGSGNFDAASWKARTIAAEIRPRKDTLRPSLIAHSRISLVVAFAGAVPAAAPVTGAFFTAVASAADSTAADFATDVFATDVFAGAFLAAFFFTAVVSATDSTAAVFAAAVVSGTDVFAEALLTADALFAGAFVATIFSAAVVFGAVVFAGVFFAATFFAAAVFFAATFLAGAVSA